MVTQKLSHKHVLFCYFIKVLQNVKGDLQSPTLPLRAFIVTIQSNPEKLQEHSFEISIPASTLVSVRNKEQESDAKRKYPLLCIPVHNIKLSRANSSSPLYRSSNQFTKPNTTDEVVLYLFV